MAYTRHEWNKGETAYIHTSGRKQAVDDDDDDELWNEPIWHSLIRVLRGYSVGKNFTIIAIAVDMTYSLLQSHREKSGVNRKYSVFFVIKSILLKKYFAAKTQKLCKLEIAFNKA